MSTTVIILANIISLIASLIMTMIGLIKSKRNILIAQSVQCALFATGNALLGGYTGVITNVMNVLRNLFCFRWKFTVWHKIAFIAIQAVLAAFFNRHGLIGWLPVIAGAIFTWCLDRDSQALKAVIIIGQLMWAVYDLYLRNYTSTFFDVLTIVTNIIGIITLKKTAAKAE